MTVKVNTHKHTSFLNACEILAHGILNKSIVLNDNDDKSESAQFEASNSNHDVDYTDNFDNTSCNSTSELMSDGFNSRTLLFNLTAADNFNADDHNDNNCITINECSLFTEQQRSASSCCDFIFDCDCSDKSEEDYIFDVFATDDDENDKDSQSIK